MIKHGIPYMVQTIKYDWGGRLKIATAVGTCKTTRQSKLLTMTFYF